MEVNANTQFKTCNTKNYIVTDTVLHGSLFSKEACIQVAQKNKAGQAVFCIAHSYGWNLVYIAKKKKKSVGLFVEYQGN